MELGLKRKVAPVTGANRGIGAAISRGFASEGMKIYLLVHDGIGLQEGATGIADAHAAETMTHKEDLQRQRQLSVPSVPAVARFG